MTTVERTVLQRIALDSEGKSIEILQENVLIDSLKLNMIYYRKTSL